MLLIAFWALAVLLFPPRADRDRPADWVGHGLAGTGLAICASIGRVPHRAVAGLWLMRRLAAWTRPACRGADGGDCLLTALRLAMAARFPTLALRLAAHPGRIGNSAHRLSAGTFLLGQGLRLLPVPRASILCCRSSGSAGLERGVQRRLCFLRGWRKKKAALKPRTTGTTPTATRSFLLTAVLARSGGLASRRRRCCWGWNCATSGQAPLWTFAGLLVLCSGSGSTTGSSHWRRMVGVVGRA